MKAWSWRCRSPLGAKVEWEPSLAYTLYPSNRSSQISWASPRPVPGPRTALGPCGQMLVSGYSAQPKHIASSSSAEKESHVQCSHSMYGYTLEHSVVP